MAVKRRGNRFHVTDEQGRKISRGFSKRSTASRREGTDLYKKHVRRMRG